MDRTIYKTNRSYFIHVYDISSDICIHILSILREQCLCMVHFAHSNFVSVAQLPCLQHSPFSTIRLHALRMQSHFMHNILPSHARSCVCVCISASIYFTLIFFLSISFIPLNHFAYAIESNILPNLFCIYWNCRDSLFASGISSSTKLPPSNTQAPGTYKFSTFGYNPLDDDVVVVGVQDIAMQSTYDRRDASITPKSTSPAVGVVYTYEHPNKYETPSPAPSSTTTTASNPLRTFGTGPKKNTVKMEQSQLMLEIRNSAPDVIIMTSHWF